MAPKRVPRPSAELPAARLGELPARARPARRRLGRCARRGDRAARATRSRPSSSRLSKSPGETVEPVTAMRIGWNAFRGFSPSRSASSRSAASIGSAVNGSTSLERLAAAREHGAAAVEQRRVGLDVVEEEAGAVRGTRRSVAIFSWTSGAAARTSSSSQSEPSLARGRRPARRRTPRAQRAQVDAVHPVELLVVERRPGSRPRARA